MDRKTYWTLGLWLALAAMVVGGATAGCTLIMQDDGTLEAGIATTLTLKQIGPKDADEKSKIGIVLDDWLEEALKRSLPEYFGIDSDGDGVNDQSGVAEDEEDAVDDAGDGGDDPVDGT